VQKRSYSSSALLDWIITETSYLLPPLFTRPFLRLISYFSDSSYHLCFGFNLTYQIISTPYSLQHQNHRTSKHCNGRDIKGTIADNTVLRLCKSCLLAGNVCYCVFIDKLQICNWIKINWWYSLMLIQLNWKRDKGLRQERKKIFKIFSFFFKSFILKCLFYYSLKKTEHTWVDVFCNQPRFLWIGCVIFLIKLVDQRLQSFILHMNRVLEFFCSANICVVSWKHLSQVRFVFWLDQPNAIDPISLPVRVIK
jgi:hypothetical protein